MNESVSKKVETFFTQYKKQSYKKGEILIRADDTPSGVYYLTEGYVKVYAISQKGEELVVNIFKPNAFFPMSWAINGTDNPYFFEAMDKVKVYRAPKEDAVHFLKENPDVLYDLLSRVYKGIDGVLTRMAYLMGGDAYGRLIAELIIYAKRFGKERENVTITISEKDLAALSGMTRETISREIKILKAKGLIKQNKHTFIITSIEKLEEEVAGGV